MKLKDYVTLANTGLDAIKRAPIIDVDTGLRCIRIQDISQNKPFYEWGYTSVSKKDYNSHVLKKGDLLVARTGATVGVSYYVQKDIESVYNNGIIKINFKNSINPIYVSYILKTKEFLNYISNVSCSSTQPNLRIETLLRFNFPFKEKKIQDKIVNILNNYDQLIENNNKRIILLESMAEDLYKEWFVRFRFPGYKNMKFVDGMPKGWEKVRLKDFTIDLESGSRPSGGIDDSLSEGLPSLGAESIGKLGEFNYSSTKLISLEFYNKMKHGKSFDNAILLYKDGAYIGKTTLFRDEFPFEKYTINEHVFLIKCKNSLFQNYLYLTLHQSAYFSLMQVLNKNSAQPGLSQPDIYRLKVVRPDQDVVIKFNEIIELIFSLIFKLAKNNRQLELQRDALLSRLMSGKVELEDKEVI